MKINFSLKVAKTLGAIYFIFNVLSPFHSKAQYCINIGSNCDCNDPIVDVEILGTSLHNINNACNTAGPITTFPASGITTATLLQGQTYAFKITSVAPVISIWIDYNHNFLYEATEWSKPDSTAAKYYNSNNISFVYSVYVTVPENAIIGQTGMRVRSRGGIPNGPTNACTFMGSGESEDYTITIAAGVNCITVPNAGSTIASDTIICAGRPDTLNLIGNSIGLGQTYQWQTSTDSLLWNDVLNETKPFFITSIAAVSYFRCKVTCSSQDAYSVPLKVLLTQPNLCYCRSNAKFQSEINIGWLQFGSLANGLDSSLLNNLSSGNIYSDFSSLPAATFNRGSTYPLRMIRINRDSVAGSNNYIFQAFVDYDRNGLYAASENIFSDTLYNGLPIDYLSSGTITIPLSASTGVTGLRAILAGYQTPAACGSYNTGETEDYLINIDFPQDVMLKNVPNSSLSIYPNPSSEQVSIYFTNPIRSNVQLTLSNTLGQLIYSENLEHFEGNYSRTLDTRMLAKGIYSIQLVSANGTTTKKLIVK